MQPGDLKPCPRQPTEAMLDASAPLFENMGTDGLSAVDVYQAMYDAAPALPPVPEIEAMVTQLRVTAERGWTVQGKPDAASIMLEAAAALQSQAAALLRSSASQTGGDVCPDDHCNRRAPCEGRAALHCHYPARSSASRDEVLEEAAVLADAVGRSEPEDSFDGFGCGYSAAGTKLARDIRNLRQGDAG